MVSTAAICGLRSSSADGNCVRVLRPNILCAGEVFTPSVGCFSSWGVTSSTLYLILCSSWGVSWLSSQYSQPSHCFGDTVVSLVTCSTPVDLKKMTNSMELNGSPLSLTTSLGIPWVATYFLRFLIMILSVLLLQGINFKITRIIFYCAQVIFAI